MKEGWEYKKLGEVATFINGDRSANYPSKKDYVVDGIPFVNAGNLIQAGLDSASLNLISQNKYDSLSQGKFVEGDILFCLRGTLGKHSIVQNGLKGAIASSLVIIRTKDGFCNKYISYYLDYKQPFIERLNNGAAQPNIPAKTMKGFSILVPPLSEQQSIVDYLDSAFAKIDAMKANAEKALNEAKALFQASLKEMLEPKEGWEEKKLIKEFSLKSGENLSAKNQVIGPYPVYGGNGITGYHNQYNLSGDQILIGRVGALCGNIHYIKERIWVTDNAFVVNNISSSWNMLFLSYELEYINLNQYASQTAQPVISNKSMKDVSIFQPPLSEQQSIVDTLDSLKSKVDRLQENYNKISQECDVLKQAILRQVFE